MKKMFLAAFAVMTMIALTGCGIGEDVEKAGKSLTKKIETTKSLNSKKEKSFKESNLAKELASYVTKENLAENFKNATSELQRAEGSLKDLKRLIKDDEEKMRNIALGRINTINKSIRLSLSFANKPMQRLEQLQATLKNAGKIESEAKTTNTYTSQKSSEIVSFIENELSTNENTSGKKDDLNKEIAMTQKIASDSATAYTVLTTEFKKGSSMDIANFLAQSDTIKKLKVAADAKDKLIQKKITEVNNSYTKILSDMREDFYIIVASTSWDEYYDSPTEHTNVQPKSKVSAEAYQRIAAISGTVATYSSGGIFGGLKLKGITQTDWNLLRVNKSRLLSRGDDASEVWIKDAPVEQFHKYVIVKNGVKTETDWIKVSEADYEKNYSNLGMSIITKPYGSYESDTITTATPAGMAYVGNKKYGEWKQDTNTGTSFWAYYGMYSFFTGGNNRYYRNDYDHYRSYRTSSPRGSYYGRNKSYGTYGTRGFKRSATTRSTMRTRMSRNSKSGRASTRSSSRNVRSTGRSSRGRGPGGGGK